MKMTPMLQQYLDIKERYPETILFFRMGDFYEMFLEDAVLVSREVGLTLTSRNKGSEDEVPMAGMPYHSCQSYIQQLIGKGYAVAICEQIEDPAMAKGIVKRDVVRVITPGVVLDEENLEATAPNYVAAFAVAQAQDGAALEQSAVGFCYLDVSTGEFRATQLDSWQEFSTELDRVRPRELLLARENEELLATRLGGRPGVFLRAKPGVFFALDEVRTRVAAGVRLGEDLVADGYFHDPKGLADVLGESSSYRDDSPLMQAVAAVLTYIVETQRGLPTHIQHLVVYQTNQFLVMDESTRANLELTQTLMGARRQGSLLSVMDRTVTSTGARKLRQRLHYPLVDPVAIGQRLDAVEELVGGAARRADVREMLEGTYDLERLCGRVSAGTANPRDLRAIYQTLCAVPSLQQVLAGCESMLLAALAQGLDGCPEVCALIGRALVENPPVSVHDGGIFRPGYHPELDELMILSGDGKDWMLAYESREKRRSGIGSLKVKYNKVFGFYIEITRSNLDHVPEDYIRKQTLANAERYFTLELKEMEERILGADDRRRQLEQALFEALRQEVGKALGPLLATADALAELDVYAALAELAQRHDYVRPVVDQLDRIHIVDGRHPVVERALESGERFVPNSVMLDGASARLHIITGPNMAGKSTVIRQVALIALMAQLGSFVPASSAHIGVVDKVFSRVGASDNLARGQSTFMVEMTETAHILCNATARSLVILDEIGRGTATFDGLSIAWAVAEYLYETIRAKTLFATHYHELTELAHRLEAAVNMSIAVREWNDNIIFLRKLVEGQANRSYGIQVGRLAGLPQAVVARAKEVLGQLEGGRVDELTNARAPRRSPVAEGPVPQLSLFTLASAPREARDPSEQHVLERLRQTDVNVLTPLEALNLLGQLGALLRESR